MANGEKPVDVWVGTTLGVLKGVTLAGGQVTNYHHASLDMADRLQEVCVMCWEHEAEGELLYCGLKNGVVQLFGCQEREFEAECDCTGGEGRFVGLGRHEGVLITCTDRGDLRFWPPEDEKVSCSVGRDVTCMAASPDTRLQVATGGKENDLKVWDGNNLAAPIFQAKNVRNDQLDLRVPVWVSNIGYVAGSGAQPTLAVATGYHQVRLYDTRAQRRPVYNQEFGEHPFTALTMVEDGRSYIVGSSVGDITRCDLRTGNILSRYKGCTGGVKGLQCYSNGEKTLLASCSLDRYLRVYSLESPSLLHKVYLKLIPNRLLFNMSQSMDAAEEEAAAKSLCEEEEDVWKKMKSVSEKPSKSVGVRKKAKLRTVKKGGTKH